MALDIGGVGGWFTNFFQILGTIFVILLLVVVFGLIMWFLFKELKFKIPVVVHKVIGENSQIIEYRDRARKLIKNGRNELKLKKLKEIIPNPPADYYIRTKKGEQLYLRWDGGHVFVPQKVLYNSPLTFKAGTYNMLNQMGFRVRVSEERHKKKNFWDLYGNIIVWVAVIVVSAMVLIIMFTKMEGFASALQSNAAAINNYAEAVKELAGKQVIQ